MVELIVVGVRMIHDSPVLILQERDGARCLPIWISSPDAAAIVVAQSDENLGRPLTHDLLCQLIEIVSPEKEPNLVITGISGGTFYGELRFGETVLDARPSDLVAVAVRRGWTIECPQMLLSEAGVLAEEAAGEEVERFREFLDSVAPDDFSTGGGNPEPGL